MRCYTDGGVIVELLDGWEFKATHIQLLIAMQAHVESVQLRCRDANGIEWYISVGMLSLDRQLLTMINA